jgi:tetratricopeptide (TPR) repeat protein
MKLGKDAAEAKRYKEAYDFYTKVVEVDPNNWRAIYERGKAGSWQSTTDDFHSIEIEQGVEQALKIIKTLDLPKEELNDIQDEFAVDLANFYIHYTEEMNEELDELENRDGDDQLCFETKGHWDVMVRTHNRNHRAIRELEKAMSLIKNNEDELSKRHTFEMKKVICDAIHDACEETFYYLTSDFDHHEYYGDTAEEKKDNLEKYWKYVCEVRETEPDFRTNKYLYPDPFGKKYSKIDEIFAYWEPKEEEYRRTKKAEAYWKDHADEKAQYDARMGEIDAELSELCKRADEYDTKIADIKEELQLSVPGEEQLAMIGVKITELEKMSGSLRLNDFVEKMEIGKRIKELTKEKNQAQKLVNEQIESRRDQVSRRVDVLESEKFPISKAIARLEKEREKLIQVPLLN